MGQNHRDHVAVSVKHHCTQPVSLFNVFHPVVAAKALANFLRCRKGPLAQPPAEIGAYVRTMPGAAHPDMKTHSAMVLYEAMGRKLIMQHGYCAHIDLLNPESVGTIRLIGPDAAAPLAIDPNILSTARATATSDIHVIGTCRMGHDPMAVVDPQLRVRGLSGLRVVDASVMPRVLGGNTNVPTIMVAEKAADMTLSKTHSSSPSQDKEA